MSSSPINRPRGTPSTIQDRNNLASEPIVMRNSTNLSEKLKFLLREIQERNKARLVQLEATMEARIALTRGSNAKICFVIYKIFLGIPVTTETKN